MTDIEEKLRASNDSLRMENANLKAEIERLRAGLQDAPAPETPKWNPDQKWLYDGLIRKARSDALEEAAHVADGHSDRIGDLIRRLKEKP